MLHWDHGVIYLAIMIGLSTHFTNKCIVSNSHPISETKILQLVTSDTWNNMHFLYILLDVSLCSQIVYAIIVCILLYQGLIDLYLNVLT